MRGVPSRFSNVATRASIPRGMEHVGGKPELGGGVESHSNLARQAEKLGEHYFRRAENDFSKLGVCRSHGLQVYIDGARALESRGANEFDAGETVREVPTAMNRSQSRRACLADLSTLASRNTSNSTRPHAGLPHRARGERAQARAQAGYAITLQFFSTARQWRPSTSEHAAEPAIGGRQTARRALRARARAGWGSTRTDRPL